MDLAVITVKDGYVAVEQTEISKILSKKWSYSLRQSRLCRKATLSSWAGCGNFEIHV